MRRRTPLLRIKPIAQLGRGRFGIPNPLGFNAKLLNDLHISKNTLKNMSKTKGLMTTTNEQLAIDDVAMLSMYDKLRTLERLLATPLDKVREIVKDGTLPCFYQGCAKMLVENNFVEYFSLLRVCREIIKMDKEQRKDTDFL